MSSGNSDYNDALERLGDFLASDLVKKESRNEATTRLHLIDQLFLVTLQWDPKCVISEEPHGKEYADYTFFAPNRILILEAKKEGTWFNLPEERNKTEVSLKGIRRGNSDLAAAIDQVTGYCQKRGTPFACVSNGHQYVCFIASRSDGVAPSEGKAVVFASLESIQNNFPDFWKLFSPEEVASQSYLDYFGVQKKAALPVPLSELIRPYPGFKDRNPLQADINVIVDIVFEESIPSEELKDDFYHNCYCQSGALSKNSLLSKKILESRYSAIFEENTSGIPVSPATGKKGVVKELSASILNKKPILLIGDVGVGKTSFINNLVRVEAKELFIRSIPIFVDLGKTATLAPVKEIVLSEIAQQIEKQLDLELESKAFLEQIYYIDPLVSN